MPKIVIQLALALLACGLLLARPIHAQGTPSDQQKPEVQQPESQKPAGEQDPALDERTAEALRSLAGQLKARQEQRAKAIAENDKASIDALDKQIQQLRWQFASLMTQIDVQKIEAPEQAKLDLLDDALEALRPIVGALNDITEPARLKRDLKKAIEETKARADTTREARDKIREVLIALRAMPESEANNVAIEQATLELQQKWIPRLAQLESKLIVLRENQRQLNLEENNWLTTVKEQAKGLVDSGVSILLCVAVFLLVFFTLRSISRLVAGRKSESAFPNRLLKVSLRILTVVLAFAAMLVVPFAREEYVLMTLGIVFVVGVGWVIAKSAPQYAEQIRLILNIGSVREGERILINGLPYRVDALRFYSRLSNPALTGGVLRIPINQLIGERSRPAGTDEPWFPCKQGDVVAIGDDLVGRIRLQTPEVVVLVERHDAPRTYPTTAFLEMNPRNLSQGFEINVKFGIDYAHQKDAVDKIPATLQADLEEGLLKCDDADALRKARVELAAAGSSSLDFKVEVQFGGKAAIHYYNLDRLVNRLLVQSCTKHGYGIPFPQVQVHGVGSK